MVVFQDIRKSYRSLPVLRSLDLTLEKGLVTAVVGHNGSGKTTLIKILLGLVKPDAGAVYFGGKKLDGSSSYRDRIGFMAQSARFPENLSAEELFDMLVELRGRSAARRDALIRTFGLESDVRKPLRHLSGGTRQKVSAVLAFMFEPEMLVLDEPTAGLDPVATGVLKDLIAEERRKRGTILLTSHIMSEVEEMADVVVFIQDGRVRFEGTPDSMRARTGAQNLERAIGRLMMQEAA